MDSFSMNVQVEELYEDIYEDILNFDPSELEDE